MCSVLFCILRLARGSAGDLVWFVNFHFQIGRKRFCEGTKQVKGCVIRLDVSSNAVPCKVLGEFF